MKDTEENKQPKEARQYSTGEEIFNAVTHGVGALLAVAGTVLMIVKAAFHSKDGLTATTITSFSIFGFSMIVLYTMSTLYHALTPVRVKKIFRIFDHTSIFFLIAGTYTPYCLVALRGVMGWVIFGIIWAMAILGITMYSIFGNKIRVVSVIVYIVMGWLVIFQILPLYRALPARSFACFLAGGTAFTGGVPFYALKKYKWTHCVWHLFCLFGSILHFFSVYWMI